MVKRLKTMVPMLRLSRGLVVLDFFFASLNVSPQCPELPLPWLVLEDISLLPLSLPKVLLC